MPVQSDRWQKINGVDVRYMTTRSPMSLVRSLWSLRQRHPHVIYLNGFFDPPFSILPQLLYLLGWWGGATRLIAARGEFGTAALAIKSKKKRAYLRAYKILRLSRGVIWHAASASEAKDIQRVMGASVRILVRADETILPEQSEKRPTANVHCHGVFFGRIVPIKGLDLLLKALADVDVRMTVDVIGPEEDRSYVARCRSLAAGVPAHIDLTFRGEIDHEQARAVLSEYDLLLMPSGGESFGQVIAEALSVSLPVMAMDVTPWTEVLRDGGGVVVPAAVPAAWSRAIADYSRLSAEERGDLRMRAGAAYDRWHARRDNVHIFEDIRKIMENSP